eukprot:TRINITY_DN1636_c0_g1_i1.p1 TRINITY_DN1636_c0_g1~~TRINITY_DN1636_c0_g1_i1.p1  ORF type:complete len:272 (+),score=59.63 TRINITY_DN1636_c0_g1_i1:433-1248(+)
MRKKEGLEAIIANSKSIESMVHIITRSRNLLMRMQILELLSAIALFSKEGHSQVFRLLVGGFLAHTKADSFKVLCKWVTEGLDEKSTAACLGFVNVLINSEYLPLDERIPARNVLITCGFLDILEVIRQKMGEDKLVRTQIDVFTEHLHADAREYDEIKAAVSVDLQDPKAVFGAVCSRLHGTPFEESFLNVLQHLFVISDNPTEETWKFVEKILHRAVTIDSPDAAKKSSKLLLTDIVKLLKKPPPSTPSPPVLCVDTTASPDDPPPPPP